MAEFQFWQTIVSPHTLGLADALVSRGHSVAFAATAVSRGERTEMGWPALSHASCSLKSIPTAAAATSLAAAANDATIHVMEGIRGNRILSAARRALISRRASLWCVLERIDERSALSPLKRVLYRRMLAAHRRLGTRFLAIGRGMPEWLVRHGADPIRVYPFAYFLPAAANPRQRAVNSRIHFVFVGQMIRRKRFDLLVAALRELDVSNLDLTVIGGGPLSATYRKQVSAVIPAERLHWRGVLPMTTVRDELASLDCLVLPSDHDGWGAVVSESLIAGTPVICSDRCGAAAAVFGPEAGFVFPHGDSTQLASCMREVAAAGVVDWARRSRLRKTAAGLTAAHGAQYLESLVAADKRLERPPDPPWAAVRDLES